MVVKMGKVLLISSLLGTIIPLVMLAFYNLSKIYCEQCASWIMNGSLWDFILLILWPSSFFLIGDPTDSNLQLQLFSLIVNVLFYMLVGLATWLAFSKSYFYFLPVILFYSWWLWFWFIR